MIYIIYMVKNIHFLINELNTKDETNFIKRKYMNKENLWKGLTLNPDKKPDYYVIMNHPGKYFYEPEKTIVIHNEPISTRKKWDNWLNSQNFFHVYKKRNIPRWNIAWNYNDLIEKPIIKTKKIIYLLLHRI
jgi:hypothetical protein